jgi:hypothetical protein
MSKKKKSPVATILDINAGLDMSPDESHTVIEISSGNGGALTPQVILDAVVDMVSSYFGVSKEEWEAMADDREDLDS